MKYIFRTWSQSLNVSIKGRKSSISQFPLLSLLNRFPGHLSKFLHSGPSLKKQSYFIQTSFLIFSTAEGSLQSIINWIIHQKFTTKHRTWASIYQIVRAFPPTMNNLGPPCIASFNSCLWFSFTFKERRLHTKVLQILLIGFYSS